MSQRFIYRASLLTLIISASFLWGFLSSKGILFPGGSANAIYKEIVNPNPFELIKTFESPLNRKERFILKDKSINGKFLISEVNQESEYVIRIYTPKGEIFREHIVNRDYYNDLFKKDNDIKSWTPYYNDRRDYVHGVRLLANEDIIFNIEYLGLVCLTKNDKIRWTRGIYTHHSVEFDLDSNIWVCGVDCNDDKVDQNHNDETVLCLDKKTGELIDFWSVKELFLKSEFTGHAFPRADNMNIDNYHINDVEPYQLQDSGGVFNRNDVLVSCRNINTVFVFNTITDSIKYISTGYTTTQHDPDFFSNHEITVFDNFYLEKGESLPISRIVKIDATNNIATTKFQNTIDGNSFYSQFMGRHQWLTKNKLLTVYPLDQSAYIINAKGELVWSYINILGPKSKGMIFDCVYYP
jgi:hypothetical protein